MKGKLLLTFLAGLRVGLIVAVAEWHPQALGQRAEKPPPWEYRTMSFYEAEGAKDLEELNRLAAEGWEYAGLLQTSTDKHPASVVALKRPKK